jgi:putative transposase
MAKVQKVYTKEFKQEAVRLAQTSGKAITQIARELGISDTSIHQWRKELAENGTEAFPGKGHQTELEEEKSAAEARKRDLAAGVRDTKKSSEHLFTGKQMKYQFIEQHKQEFPVVVMCQVLGVSESGFSACRHHQEDAQLMQEIRQVFVAHRGRYESPRIQSELKDQGRHIARKRVARLMREAEMRAQVKEELKVLKG